MSPVFTFVKRIVFRPAEVFVLAEVCLSRRPHADQPRSDDHVFRNK